MTLTDSTYDAFVRTATRKQQTVLIGCLVTWCRYCRRLEKTLETLKKVLQEKNISNILIETLDCDKNKEAATKLHVSNYPSFHLTTSQGLGVPNPNTNRKNWEPADIVKFILKFDPSAIPSHLLPVESLLHVEKPPKPANKQSRLDALSSSAPSLGDEAAPSPPKVDDPSSPPHKRPCLPSDAPSDETGTPQQETESSSSSSSDVLAPVLDDQQISSSSSSSSDLLSSSDPPVL